MKYRDRYEAGRLLATQLAAYANHRDVLVLALSRGGVPVAFEVAKALSAPLDIFLLRKLGVPGHEELSMGTIASGGVRVLDDEVVNYLGISGQVIDEVATKERQELERRESEFRGSLSPLQVRGRTVILVDDGLAAGVTLRAAIIALRQHRPAQIVAAIPVTAGSSCKEFRMLLDECVCQASSEPAYAVGLWYEDFTQATDDEVRHLLAQAAEPARLVA